MATIDDRAVQAPGHHPADEDDAVDVLALLAPAGRRWRTVLAATLACGVLAVGFTYLLKPRFTAVCTFLPPVQQQNNAASALASLGALTGMSLGSSTSTRNSPEQYVALMQGVGVSDRIIARYHLRTLWDERYEIDARKRLAHMVAISSGKKDGLMTVEVTDTDPVRAASIANQYVEELRYVTNHLAISEAQQRRVFFEHLLEQTRDKLAAAQTALEASGFTEGAANAEPRTVAESYARVRAELTAAEVKLQVLRRSMADSSAQVQTQQEQVNALSAQLAKMADEEAAGHPGNGDYVNRYREFKYQETLFTLFPREYETARVDESREGGLVQVVDPATPPEYKSWPSRMLFGLGGAVFGLVAATVWALRREGRRA